MRIFNSIKSTNITRPVVTIGFFDGVHIGHQTILKKTIEKAKELNRESLLITFWPHPRIVLNKDAASLKLLTSLEEKKKILASIDLDGMLIMEFTPELATKPPRDFIQEILIDKLNISAIVLGYNHVFGSKGEGNYILLKELENKGNFTAHQIDPISVGEINVSSTKIRSALEQGLLNIANAMLSRDYSITGTIEGGRQLGRDIGYPTANISPSEPLKQIPGDGVYAVWVDYNKNSYPAMLNIGHNPTVEDGLHKTIEAHIIGFKENIYDKEITVRFIKKIREELKFPSLDALKEQLAIDKVTTLKLLEND
ncbi:MAG: bifunctional riboflavin kinase/FAD synthetase [Bacteroidales bacterium]